MLVLSLSARLYGPNPVSLKHCSHELRGLLPVIKRNCLESISCCAVLPMHFPTFYLQKVSGRRCLLTLPCLVRVTSSSNESSASTFHLLCNCLQDRWFKWPCLFCSMHCRTHPLSRRLCNLWSLFDSRQLMEMVFLLLDMLVGTMPPFLPGK